MRSLTHAAGALRILLSLACIGLWSLLAADLTGGPTLAWGGAGEAIVRWTTDVPTGSRVQFGTATGALNQEAVGESGTNHLVSLRRLTAGTHYRFAVGTARRALATNAFVFLPDAAPVVLHATGTPSDRPNLAPAITAGRTNATSAAAPPARKTWGSPATLQDHFDRHGRDFQAKDPEDYARMAWELLQRARRGELLMKVDTDGVIRVSDPKTRAFGAYNRDGTTKTFFRPQSPDYFERQPGELVKPKPTR